MSLINKMLQDLDARGGADRQAAASVAAMVQRRQAPRQALVAGAGAAAVVLAAAGWYGWTTMHAGRAGGATAPVRAGVDGPAPAPALPTVIAAPLAAPAPAVAEAAKVEEKPVAEIAAELKTAKQAVQHARAEAAALAAQHRARQAPPLASASATTPQAAPARARDPVRESARLQPKDVAGAPQPVAGGVTMTSQQQGDNAYKRALAALQEGRVQEAFAQLEQAVLVFPRHDAARQTLVGLLLEARRNEEAIRHLQLGLGLDLRQPQMAMLLARLQIEKGSAAIETLQRTLPYAGANPDYLAFLAGVLQKAQRHHEAVEQYQAALRLMPHNGIWWMGLGISLQADKRGSEAQDAYARAKASGSLTPELTSFVERKLQQMAR